MSQPATTEFTHKLTNLFCNISFLARQSTLAALFRAVAKGETSFIMPRYALHCIKIYPSLENTCGQTYTVCHSFDLEELKMAVKKALLEILACPACHGEVEYFEEKAVIQCNQCRRQYPVRDDIPIMLVDEAKIPAEDR